jgi:poly(ADP-ribose) glycohydrolase ARH3
MRDPYDFEKAIREAIRGGGDTDTIASIVGALSGAFNGLEAIPAQWVEQLENSPKGRDYIKQIANQLYELSEQKRKTGS